MSLGLLLAGLSVSVPGPAHAAESRFSPEQEAKLAVKEARAAAREGKWQAALEAFTRAMNARPSPKLHYNIAVCHHRLALAAPAGSPEREASTAAAIDSYNTYLREVKDSPDAEQVRATIVSLGGTPVGDGPTVKRVDTPGDKPALDDRGHQDLWDESPPPEDETDEMFVDDPAPSERPRPDAEPAPAPSPAPPTARADRLPRVQLQVAAVSATVNPVDSIRSSAVDAPFSMGASAGVGILLTPSRALSLGLEVTLVGGIPFQRSKHGLWTFNIAIAPEYRLTFGRSRRVALGLGGLVGVSGQTLRTRGVPGEPVSCPVGQNGEVSKRGGLFLGGRAGVFGLFGRKRNHAVGLRITPALHAMGPGAAESGCRDKNPFAQVGLSTGAGFGFYSDVGYHVRF